MDEFIIEIIKSLTTEGRRLSVVSNPDDFLRNPVTQEKIFNSSGLLLLPISSALELRVRYELEDKNSINKVCYVFERSNDILPDIKSQLFIAPTFTISKILPGCNEFELLQAGLTFDMAKYIYNKKITYNLSRTETKIVISEAQELYGLDIQDIASKLKLIPLLWDKPETIVNLSELLLKLISKGAIDELDDLLKSINDNFQCFINDKYLSYINSSHIQKPKIVNKILPHLNFKHQRNEKVALVVIDGMAYWQYLILDKLLSDNGISTKKDMVFSWIPSITKLSRQAIFRGEAPKSDYRQSPLEESKLWKDFWTSDSRKPQKRMESHEINYTFGSLLIENNHYYKQAFVDGELDEKMHNSSNYKDLYSLTMNWANDTAAAIISIYKNGYNVYITTDHGNIFTKPWRLLSSEEKTYLYTSESRGKRHLMYSKPSYLDNFINSNTDIKDDLLINNNWAVWRNTNNFTNHEELTHGGSHFLEVIIPFITIEQK